MSPFKKLTLAVASLALSGAAFADTYAIVVGVNEYPDPTDATGNPLKDENGNPVSSKLRGAVNDAKGVQKLLIDNYDVDAKNIKVLTDKDATGDNLVKAFGDVFKELGPDDQFVFYFSGHGFHEGRIVVDVRMDGRTLSRRDIARKGGSETIPVAIPPGSGSSTLAVVLTALPGIERGWEWGRMSTTIVTDFRIDP